ncbi:MAG: hypothetical protein LIP09_11950 [Bacteroidales bacterium]|nr:hypothetical protein [Bacteroidales bacterium]
MNRFETERKEIRLAYEEKKALLKDDLDEKMNALRAEYNVKIRALAAEREAAVAKVDEAYANWVAERKDRKDRTAYDVLSRLMRICGEKQTDTIAFTLDSEMGGGSGGGQVQADASINPQDTEVSRADDAGRQIIHWVLLKLANRQPNQPRAWRRPCRPTTEHYSIRDIPPRPSIFHRTAPNFDFGSKEQQFIIPTTKRKRNELNAKNHELRLRPLRWPSGCGILLPTVR